MLDFCGRLWYNISIEWKSGNTPQKGGIPINSHYLSEIFELTDFSKDKINLLPQGTGTGKTSLAFKLIHSIPNAKSLYVIDTTAGKESLLEREDTEEYSDVWQKRVEDKIVFLDELSQAEIDQEMEILFQAFQTKTVVITYRKLGHILQKYRNFLDHLDIIIFDEVHNLINYYNRHDKPQVLKKVLGENPHLSKQEQSVSLDIMSPLYRVIYGLNSAVKANNYLIAMSATPKLFYEQLSQMELEVANVETDKALYSQEVLRRKYFKDLKKEIDNLQLQGDDIAIIFMTQISHMISMKEYIEQTKGYKTIALWSVNNKDNKLSQEQLDVILHLKQYQKVPPGYQIVLMNKAYETSINIWDNRIKHCMINTVDEDSKVQSQGRIRNGILQNLYIKYTDEKELLNLILIPRFWRKRIGTEEKNALVEELNQAFGKNWSWKKWRNWIEKKDIEIEDVKSGSNRFTTLTSKITL